MCCYKRVCVPKTGKQFISNRCLSQLSEKKKTLVGQSKMIEIGEIYKISRKDIKFIYNLGWNNVEEMRTAVAQWLRYCATKRRSLVRSQMVSWKFSLT
jgi:hypothetical protein